MREMALGNEDWYGIRLWCGGIYALAAYLLHALRTNKLNFRGSLSQGYQKGGRGTRMALAWLQKAREREN